MDKRSESQFDYQIKERTGADYSAMPNKYTSPGSETREEVLPANFPLKSLIKHGDNPISGDDIAVGREVDKYIKERRQNSEKVMAQSLNTLGANKGKAKNVAAAAKATKEAKGSMY